MNFDVPQQATAQMRMGREVRITTRLIVAAGAEFHGRITAIDSVVNAETRNIQVQATLANPDGQLRPGMFVQAEVVLGAGRSVVALPATAISYAPYGDSVFVVADLKGPNGESYRGVRQQFVKVEGARGDQVGVDLGREAGRRSRHVRGVQAAQRRGGARQQQGAAGEQPGAEAGGQLTERWLDGPITMPI